MAEDQSNVVQMREHVASVAVNAEMLAEIVFGATDNPVEILDVRMLPLMNDLVVFKIVGRDVPDAKNVMAVVNKGETLTRMEFKPSTSVNGGDPFDTIPVPRKAWDYVVEVHRRFRNDEAQGFRSRDRQYAIDLLGQAMLWTLGGYQYTRDMTAEDLGLVDGEA